MASTPASEVSDGPVLSVINKRLRALRKKHSRIVQMEESAAKGKALNKEQEETVRSKAAVLAGIEELEKLRLPLAAALAEEIRPVEDLLPLLYFGSMFDVKSLQADLTATVLTRTMERACCLSYDCMTDDDSTDLLAEADLDLISTLSGLLLSRPVNSPLSHSHALHQCIHHAKLWLANSDQHIHPHSHVTYAALRSKLDKIIASLYFTTDPVKVDAAACNYASYPVPVQEDHAQVEVDSAQEEAAVSSHNLTSETHTRDELQQEEQDSTSELPAEPEEVVHESEGVDNLKAADLNEQHAVPRRSHQNYRGNRGGSRGYSNGHGGRGRGGSYQNGRNQYYDQSGNYHPRNYYNYRGRGGRGTGGGGSYSRYAPSDQAGNFSADS